MDCQICLDLLIEPQIYNCGHTFCIKCMINMLKSYSHILATPICPICKRYAKYIAKNYQLADLISHLNNEIKNDDNINHLYIELNSLSKQKFHLREADEDKLPQLIFDNNGYLIWTN